MGDPLLENPGNTLSCVVFCFVLWKDLLDKLRWVKYQVLHTFIILKCPSAQGLHVCKMLTLQLQDAQNQLPTDAVHVLILSVASRWNENGQVLVWNLLVLQLMPKRHWPMIWQVPIWHTVTCWSCFNRCHTWFLVKHCEISFGVLEAPCGTCQVAFSVFRIPKDFAVPLCVLTWEEKSSPAKSSGEKYLWMKLF